MKKLASQAEKESGRHRRRTRFQKPNCICLQKLHVTARNRRQKSCLIVAVALPKTTEVVWVSYRDAWWKCGRWKHVYDTIGGLGCEIWDVETPGMCVFKWFSEMTLFYFSTTWVVELLGFPLLLKWHVQDCCLSSLCSNYNFSLKLLLLNCNDNKMQYF